MASPSGRHLRSIARCIICLGLAEISVHLQAHSPDSDSETDSISSDMAIKSFTGGDKLKAKLQEIADKAGRNALLKVGFLEGSTETKSAIPTATVAAINEFGGTVPARTVPARVVKIYRRVSKTGAFLNGAKFTKKGKSNFETEHIVPEHEIPEHTIPARPFFRRMIKLGGKHWGEDLGDMLVARDYDVDRAMAELGTQMVGELQKSILDPVYVPLAKSTIAKKGNDQTLVDSGDMLNAVDFEVETK